MPWRDQDRNPAYNRGWKAARLACLQRAAWRCEIKGPRAPGPPSPLTTSTASATTRGTSTCRPHAKHAMTLSHMGKRHADGVTHQQIHRPHLARSGKHLTRNDPRQRHPGLDSRNRPPSEGSPAKVTPLRWSHRMTRDARLAVPSRRNFGPMSTRPSECAASAPAGPPHCSRSTALRRFPRGPVAPGRRRGPRRARQLGPEHAAARKLAQRYAKVIDEARDPAWGCAGSRPLLLSLPHRARRDPVAKAQLAKGASRRAGRASSTGCGRPAERSGRSVGIVNVWRRIWGEFALS